MKALNRKVLRDLRLMRGQALAIAIVITSGMAAFVMFIGAMESLTATRDRFYRDYAFADVFVSLKRAPESLRSRIAAIPGVSVAETRVVAPVKLDIEGFPEPVTAQMISVPEHGSPLLNRLYIRSGRMPDPARDDETVVSETFAQAHGFKPGDRIGAIINGRKKSLVITGVGLSPEFVLIMRPEALSPDFKRFGILWMGRKALGKSYNMDGAFNDVVMAVQPGADTGRIITELDMILEKYGGLGAYARKDQMSNRMLSEEFRMLRRSAEIYPTIFILVAAFLLNVVISRTVSIQREQIAALKAFGYENADIAIHYAKLVILIVLLGLAGGSVLGIWLEQRMGQLYMDVYRFPSLVLRINPLTMLAATGISVLSALAGTLHAVWRAARETPAEAMRPEPPAKYRVSYLERIGIGRWLSQPSRIILRNVERKPVRTFLSILGIAVACATMLTSGFFSDAVNYLVQVQFRVSQKEDMTVAFVEPTSRRVVYDLAGLEGVHRVEGFRQVPVRFRFGHRSYKTVIDGVEPDGRLHSQLNDKGKPVPIPSSGLLLGDYLGELLDVKPGDTVTVEVLEGNREVLQIPVAAMSKQFIGTTGTMDLAALNRLLRQGDAVSGAYLTADTNKWEDLYRQFIRMPRVSGITLRTNEIRNFYDVQAKGMLFFTFVATLMACSIAVGVVYNSARIALSERSRELSSLRVLGYTRGEVSYILLGELGLLVLTAIPLGFLIGYSLCVLIAWALANDLFRIPMVLDPPTYSMAAAVVLISAVVSALIVRRKLDRLDLVEVLKTRE